MANIIITETTPTISVNATSNVVTVTNNTSNVVFATVAAVSNAAVRAAISVTDAGGDGSLSYANTTGVFTYTGPSASEVRSHFSATSPITLSSGAIGINSAAVFSGKTTDDLAEGSNNLYFTNTRADARITAYTGALANLTGNVKTTANVIATRNIVTGGLIELTDISTPHILSSTTNDLQLKGFDGSGFNTVDFNYGNASSKA